MEFHLLEKFRDDFMKRFPTQIEYHQTTWKWIPKHPHMLHVMAINSRLFLRDARQTTVNDSISRCKRRLGRHLSPLEGVPPELAPPPPPPAELDPLAAAPLACPPTAPSHWSALRDLAPAILSRSSRGDRANRPPPLAPPLPAGLFVLGESYTPA